MALKSTERTLRKCMRKLIRKKHLDNITIFEICEAAQIGRRTFYRYYADKYALFEVTYVKEFYNKLGITEDTSFYDIYERTIGQMYEDQDFFLHAIAVKGQNGFWDLYTDLMFPHVVNLLSRDPYIDRAKEYFIRADIGTRLHMIEEWILGGYRESPDEIYRFIRLCGAIHGKWEYQLAMGKEPDKYSLEQYENNEW